MKPDALALISDAASDRRALDELMRRDPSTLTRDDLLALITRFRATRASWELRQHQKEEPEE